MTAPVLTLRGHDAWVLSLAFSPDGRRLASLDAEGRKRHHRFERAIMRSAARLTYEEVQARRDGLAGAAPLVSDALLASLYGAFAALEKARIAHGALELDLVEHRVVLDDEGRPSAVLPRQRLDSHRLIEEFMIAANVAAAEELEARRRPCMYRVHDRPSDEKLRNLGEFLQTFGISLPASGAIQPRNVSHVLEIVRGRPEERIVNETVLRSQSQAAYEPDNIGHFGLGLARYAHFTSPIRRYADLLVHRALIAGLRLGDGALHETEAARFPDTAEHITQTERRAAAAEPQEALHGLEEVQRDRILQPHREALVPLSLPRHGQLAVHVERV